jgi:hypothetical protein
MPADTVQFLSLPMISGGEKPKPRYQAHKLKGLMLATWVMFSIGP